MEKNRIRHILSVMACLILCGLVIFRYEEFVSFQDYGMGLFVISLLGILIALLMKCLPEEHRYQKPESLLLFFITPLLMEVAVEMLNGNMLWDIDLFGNIVMNYLINLIIQGMIWAISGSICWSMRISCIILEVFGIVNFFVKQFKGSPLLPWDITSIQTAAAVADSYT